MAEDRSAGHFTFPPWANLLRPALVALLVGGPLYLAVLLGLGLSPRTRDVGYEPVQPVPYNHALHAGELGLDCRYCHATVEKAAFAALPPTEVCMNCHRSVRAASPKLLPVRESYATGMSVPWVRVHDLPDYVHFDHSAHVRAGVGCVVCHGRVDKMERVYQVNTLSMGWCLDCHRDPDPFLRPPESVTRMDWVAAEDPAVLGRRLREAGGIKPSTDCSTCHR